MFCPRCGTKNSENANFCSKCGESFAGWTGTSFKEQEYTQRSGGGAGRADIVKTGDKKILRTVVFMLAAFALVAGVVMFFAPKTFKGEMEYAEDGMFRFAIQSDGEKVRVTINRLGDFEGEIIDKEIVDGDMICTLGAFKTTLASVKDVAVRFPKAAGRGTIKGTWGCAVVMDPLGDGNYQTMTYKVNVGEDGDAILYENTSNVREIAAEQLETNVFENSEASRTLYGRWEEEAKGFCRIYWTSSPDYLGVVQDIQEIEGYIDINIDG